MQHQILFTFETGEDVEISASINDNLLELAQKANVAIDSPCSGNVSCGKCKVKLVSGTVKSGLTRHLSESEWEDGYRLACNSFVCADAVVLVPDIASAYKSRMKTADLSSAEEVRIFENTKAQIADTGIIFKNDLMQLQIAMPRPSPDSTMPDNERFLRALKRKLALPDSLLIHLPYNIVKKLPDMLRESDFQISCILEKRKNLYYVLDISAQSEPVYGLAVDIGTTTVSAVIIDMETTKIAAKASSGNAQIRYGADIINRIMQSLKPGGAVRLQDAIITETLNPIIDVMCETQKINKNRIVRACIASNTTMNHLFLGLNADYMRRDPFIPVFFEIHDSMASDLGLHISAQAELMIAPNIGSYVGGDITSGTLSSMIWNKEEFSLFIDLGTNGELVFGNKDFLMSCACSAGPAFEGGDISCGMRATDGAIEAVTIDKNTFEPAFHVIGDTKPAGLCGSGIIDMISELYRTGIINSKGRIVKQGKRIRRDASGIANYVIAFKEDAASVKDIAITEVDIDNFIRAKAAIFSAIKTMLQLLDMDVSVIESVRVAGGIGSGVNMANAVNIGMLPDIPLEKYSYIGNSSLTGAYSMLASNQAEQKVFEIARSMTYVELSTNNRYMEEFVAACFIPHTDESLFPSVKKSG